MHKVLEMMWLAFLITLICVVYMVLMAGPTLLLMVLFPNTLWSIVVGAITGTFLSILFRLIGDEVFLK